MKKRTIERIDKKYSIEEIFNYVIFGRTKPPYRINIDGHNIKINSHRLMCFKQKGIKCVSCGVKGLYFYKERSGHKDHSKNTGPFHLNLYAIKNSEEVLMTKDHIIPKSKDGKNELSNYQTMCTNCNSKKGNKTKS